MPTYAKPKPGQGLEFFKELEYPGIKKGLYLISDFGNVYSYANNKMRSQINDYINGGYRSVSLQCTEEGKECKTVSIHRLVATNFIPMTEEDIEMGRHYVNHKDNDPSHNWDDNLEWVTNGENIAHGYLYRGKESVKRKFYENNKDHDNHWNRGEFTKGETNGMSRITEEQAIRICELLQEGKTGPEIALEVLGDASMNNKKLVWKIKERIRWTHISKDYKF